MFVPGTMSPFLQYTNFIFYTLHSELKKKPKILLYYFIFFAAFIIRSLVILSLNLVLLLRASCQYVTVCTLLVYSRMYSCLYHSTPIRSQYTEIVIFRCIFIPKLIKYFGRTSIFGENQLKMQHLY